MSEATLAPAAPFSPPETAPPPGDVFDPESIGDLLERLGGVSPSRVRLRPWPGTATEADVIAIEARENRLCELIDGVLVEKGMGYTESRLASELIVDLAKDYKGKGLEIVGLNYNEEGSPDVVKKTIKAFLDENKASYRCFVGDEKTQMLVPDFEGYPTTLFIDRAGKVRLKVVGYHEKEVLEEIVKTLLADKAE